MKTLRVIRTLFLALGILLPPVAQAQFIFTTNNGAITITGYVGTNTDISIPEYLNGWPVTGIATWAFYNPSVTSVTIPDSVTSIADAAFFDCSSLTNLTVGSGVADIGDWAFAFCPSLSSVNFRCDAPTLGSDVFYGSAAALFYLPGAVGWTTGIEGHPVALWNPPLPYSYATNYVQNVYGGPGPDEGLSLPETIAITGYTGSDTTLAIPAMINFLPVQAISYDAFYFSTNLTTVTMDDHLASIGASAFASCSSLMNITIPNGVISISNSAFSLCSQLRVITLDSGVTSIGNLIFEGCSNLTAINVDPENPAYSSVGGVLFDKNQTTLLAFPGGVSGNYTIPGSVTNIGTNAFYESVLSSVTIPDSVRVIGTAAFENCSSLTNITIPNSVNSIGCGAFYSCTNLASVTIGSGVTNIAGHAFASCTGLKTVYFLGNAPTLGGFYASSYVFPYSAIGYFLPGSNFIEYSDYNYGGLRLIPWPSPYPVIGNGQFANPCGEIEFDFVVYWATNRSIVIEAATNLANPVWTPVETDTLENGLVYFSDYRWTNHPNRFYRVTSP